MWWFPVNHPWIFALVHGYAICCIAVFIHDTIQEHKSAKYSIPAQPIWQRALWAVVTPAFMAAMGIVSLYESIRGWWR